jgi:hypothetical protein
MKFQPFRMLTPKIGTLSGLIVSIAALCAPVQGQSPSPESRPGQQQSDPFVKKDAGPPAPKAAVEPSLNLSLTVEVYAMTKTDAALLMDATASGTDRYNGARELLKRGKAKLETLINETTKGGQRAMIEHIEEVRYPTEFHAPLAPGEPPLATGFETRNVGDSLEFEPTLDPADRKKCDLNYVFSSVRFRGFLDVNWPEEISLGGNAAVPIPNAQPVFQTAKMTTGQRMKVGSNEFLGAFSDSPQARFGALADSLKPERTDIRWVFGRLDVQEVVPSENMTQAQVPFDSQHPRVLQPQIQVYSMDREIAQSVLAQSLKPGDCYAATKKLADNNQARLEPDLILTSSTKSGQRMMIEDIREIKFPSEYSVTVDGTSNARKVPTSSTSVAQQSKGKPAYYPSGFETRKAGFSLEIEPMVGPNGIVEVNLVPQLVQHLGKLEMEGTAAKYYPEQPLFETRKITTSLSVTPGQQTLVGTLNPPGEDGVNGRKDTGRVWLCFLRVNLVDPD